jgi:hypothetical protein
MESSAGCLGAGFAKRGNTIGRQKRITGNVPLWVKSQFVVFYADERSAIEILLIEAAGKEGFPMFLLLYL